MPARVSAQTLERIVALIERSPGIRTVEVAARTGLQLGGVRRAVHALASEGRIELCPRVDNERRVPGDIGYDPGWQVT